MYLEVIEPGSQLEKLLLDLSFGLHLRGPMATSVFFMVIDELTGLFRLVHKPSGLDVWLSSDGNFKWVSISYGITANDLEPILEECVALERGRAA